jgi:release factor glutamine methyltransferase
MNSGEDSDMDRNLIHCKFVRMTIQEASRLAVSRLSDIYDEREASAIAGLIMDRLTGISKSQRLLLKAVDLEMDQQNLFGRYLNELMDARPVQYVLGEAWFGGLVFYVNEKVLIPRPETEELAAWILEDSKSRIAGTIVLDIGTGSGCIPIYLSSVRKDFRMFAGDVSEDALEIAKLNNDTHGTRVEFFRMDILGVNQVYPFASPDIIVSNPPYIPEGQRETLERHVHLFEPSLALFAPDADPIIFYKAIGNYALQHLNAGGAVFLEIHHDFAREVLNWYEKQGFSVELKKDFSGNNRMIKACRY